MAKPPTINPLNYVVERQYNEGFIKNRLFSERLNVARNLYRKDLLAHFGCVNAIEFSENGEFLISGGDDKRVLLWTLTEAIYDRGSPIPMTTTHGSNIFCLTFDSRNKRIFSGGNDDQVLIHEINTLGLRAAVPHEKPVYGIGIHPKNDNIFATAGEDGRILLYDMRDNLAQDVQLMAQQSGGGFHSVMFNPANPRFFVTANADEGICLWDCRKPKVPLVHYDSKCGKASGISACFDSSGRKVLAIRRRLPPVMYATENEQAVCQFFHPQYYNSCTMKTCSFAGVNDEYILSGSDDFNLYMWKVPTDESEWGSSHIVLRGHRSIVNQVRYNSHNNLIASSGVEKMVKLWSVLPEGNWKGSILKQHSECARVIYTHDDYISLVGSPDRINHDYSDQSTHEDARMIAFFDSLIQRELEGWRSDSDSIVDSDSEDDMDWNKVISQIYKNGRHSDEPRSYRSNRITQLISKKKHSLARLAHYKASSSYLERCRAERKHRRMLTKIWNPHSRRYYNRKCQKRSRLQEKHKKERPKKYITQPRRRTLHDQYKNTNDIPTTSTGFAGIDTSMYRVVEEDSDDESQNLNGSVEENQVIPDNPTSNNCSKEAILKALEEPTDESPKKYRCQDNSKHIESTDSNEDLDETPTESASSLMTVSPEDPSDSPPHQECDEDEGVLSASTDSDHDIELSRTPLNSLKRRASVCDSGCTTGPSSSASSYSTRQVNNNIRNRLSMCSSVVSDNGDSSDGQYHSEKFRKRARKARLNLRRKIVADSDSN